jgi:uncharacterized membrane protein
MVYVIVKKSCWKIAAHFGQSIGQHGPDDNFTALFIVIGDSDGAAMSLTPKCDSQVC